MPTEPHSFKPKIIPMPKNVAITAEVIADELNSFSVRAIILDCRQRAIVVHYEDGTPSNFSITEDSIPYLMQYVPIESIGNYRNLDLSLGSLTTFATNESLIIRAFVANPRNTLEVDNALYLRSLSPSYLLMVASAAGDSPLSECRLIAAEIGE